MCVLRTWVGLAWVRITKKGKKKKKKIHSSIVPPLLQIPIQWVQVCPHSNATVLKNEL